MRYTFISVHICVFTYVLYSTHRELEKSNYVCYMLEHSVEGYVCIEKGALTKGSKLRSDTLQKPYLLWILKDVYKLARWRGGEECFGQAEQKNMFEDFIFMSSWRIDCFIIIKYFSLRVIILFVLKYIFSDMPFFMLTVCMVYLF